MNGVKGEAVVLNRRRSWADALAPSLHANSVDAATLEAMQAACVASFPSFRRYLRAKAALLGSGEALPWWDLLAPVGAASVSWDDACAEVVDAFGTYSPPLRALAERALAEGWVDAAPRAGKRGGAFCAGLRGDESRILMTFSESFDAVTTLAHELGHAYHNVTLADRTPLQRQLPMALAETASIFCETVLVQAGLARAQQAGDVGAQLALLDNDLAGATMVVVDIHSRFLFEREVFARRAGGTLSVADLCGLMVDSQREAYGDGLAPEALHPYMWAVKPHYYSTSFYNWPYTFGLLFGIGLYARYVEEPERFRQGYDDLLSSVGMGEAAELAARFDIDVRDRAFWEASLAVLERRIDEFCALAGDRVQ
jgi:pepF/M3 family oligoendopeptidase